LVEDLSLLANPGEGCLRLSSSRFVDYSTTAYQSTWENGTRERGASHLPLSTRLYWKRGVLALWKYFI